MGNHFGDIRWLEGREGFQYLGGVMYAAKGAGGGGDRVSAGRVRCLMGKRWSDIFGPGRAGGERELGGKYKYASRRATSR